MQTNSRREIQLHYKRAEQALQARQDSSAAEGFREILRLDPKNAQAHANLGVIVFGQRRFEEAGEEFGSALKLQPSLWNAKAFLGMSELRLGKRQEAATHLEEALRNVENAKLRTQVGMDLVALYYQPSKLDQAADVRRVLQRVSHGVSDVLYTAYRTYSDLAALALLSFI